MYEIRKRSCTSLSHNITIIHPFNARAVDISFFPWCIKPFIVYYCQLSLTSGNAITNCFLHLERNSLVYIKTFLSLNLSFLRMPERKTTPHTSSHIIYNHGRNDFMYSYMYLVWVHVSVL